MYVHNAVLHATFMKDVATLPWERGKNKSNLHQVSDMAT